MRKRKTEKKRGGRNIYVELVEEEKEEKKSVFVDPFNVVLFVQMLSHDDFEETLFIRLFISSWIDELRSTKTREKMSMYKKFQIELPINTQSSVQPKRL
jgi:hypothetical protein